MLSGLELAPLIAAGSIWAGGTWRARKALRKFSPIGRMIDVMGAPLHVHQMGSGPDLVMIHGSNANMREYIYSLVPHLVGKYRITLMDRPGLGHSPARNPRGDHVFDQARVLAAAADQLGVQNPVVIGHSYGGAVALAWAGLHLPARAFVLISSPANLWTTPLATFYKITAHPILRIPAIPVIAAIATDRQIDDGIADVFAPDPVPSGYRDTAGIELALRRPNIRANALNRAQLRDQMPALMATYGGITEPIEAVHGTADTIVSLRLHEPALRSIPSVNLTILDDIGHMPHHAVPDQVLAAISRADQRSRIE